jgi:hypothetical protein
MRCPGYAAGIWPWSADNTIFQYNEACNVHGTKDGQGFDSDYNSRNTIFQYNYSHDNDGGFMLVCSMPIEPYNIGNIDTIVRYNISQNDNDKIFHITGELDGTYIYNNVIYVKDGIEAPMILFDNWGKKLPKRTYFYNNIFYVDGKVNYLCKTNEKPDAHPLNPQYMKEQEVFFSNNVFYGNHVDPPYDPHVITDDPMLKNPGSGSMGLTSVDGYKLKTGSPCIGAGKIIENPGALDYWRNKLKEGKPKPCIGAHETDQWY